jgi:hypothetical protein
MFLKIIITILLLGKSNSCPITIDKEYNVISDFSCFKDLNFTDCYIPLQKTSALEIRPNKKIILDDSLNMTGLIIASKSRYFGLIFTNIKGIDFKSNYMLDPQLKFESGYGNEEIFLNLKSSNFDFYFGNQLMDRKLCDEKYFWKVTTDKKFSYWKNAFLLSEIRHLFLKNTVKFSEQTCPLIFSGLILKMFAIEKLSNTFILKNILGFYYDIPPNNSSKFSRPIIIQFSATLYHIDLKKTFLNEMIFANLSFLDLYGKISSIENGLFKYLYSLKVLRIHTQNAKSLLTNNNKWLEYLNFNINLDPIDINYMFFNKDKMFILSVIQTFYESIYYDYPEEVKFLLFFKNNSFSTSHFLF